VKRTNYGAPHYAVFWNISTKCEIYHHHHQRRTLKLYPNEYKLLITFTIIIYMKHVSHVSQTVRRRKMSPVLFQPSVMTWNWCSQGLLPCIWQILRLFRTHRMNILLMCLQITFRS